MAHASRWTRSATRRRLSASAPSSVVKEGGIVVGGSQIRDASLRLPRCDDVVGPDLLPRSSRPVLKWRDGLLLEPDPEIDEDPAAAPEPARASVSRKVAADVAAVPALVEELAVEGGGGDEAFPIVILPVASIKDAAAPTAAAALIILVLMSAAGVLVGGEIGGGGGGGGGGCGAA